MKRRTTAIILGLLISTWISPGTGAYGQEPDKGLDQQLSNPAEERDAQGQMPFRNGRLQQNDVRREMPANENQDGREDLLEELLRESPAPKAASHPSAPVPPLPNESGVK
ncbi:MAG TPA: hypothetical protein VF799_05270 [Geobacteraceae bacterium]